MDDSGIFQPIQNNPQQGTIPSAPVGQTPSTPVQPEQPVQSPQPSQSVQPLVQPVSTPSVQPVSAQPLPTPEPPTSASSPADGTGPRITLSDLYGPSTPQETPPVQPEVPQAPIQPLPQEPAPIQAPETVMSTPLPTEPVSQPDVTPSLSFAPKTNESTAQGATNPVASSPGSGSGGFHIYSLIKFLVGGIVILLVLLIVWGIISFISSRQNAGNGHVTLTYWGLWENSSVMQPIIDAFEKQHPNITVTYSQEDPKQYTQRLLTRMQQGDGPDIFRLNNTWVYPLQSILLPLPTAVIDAKSLATNYPPVVTKDMVMGGAVYGLPLEMDTLSLFVNNDIFSHAGAQVPTTWDNFITVAKALTVKDPDGRIQTAGAALGTYDNVAHAPDILSLLLLQNGADVTKLGSGSNAKDALSFYTSFASPDNSVWDTTLDNSLLSFERGKLAMYFGYSYDVFAIKAASPSLNFAVYPVPHLPGRNITIASYWVEGVSNRSKHQKEALEFMQYLSQKDTQANIYTQEAKSRMFGELYARTDLSQGLVQNTLLAQFVKQFPQAQSSFFVDSTDYDEYNGALNQYLGNAINSMLKDTSVDSATATLAQGVAQVTSQFAPKTQ